MASEEERALRVSVNDQFKWLLETQSQIPTLQHIHRFPDELKPFPDRLEDKGQTMRLLVCLQHFTIQSWHYLRLTLSLPLILRSDTLVLMESDCLVQSKVELLPASFAVHLSHAGWCLFQQSSRCSRDGAVQNRCCVDFSVVASFPADSVACTPSPPVHLQRRSLIPSLPISLGDDWVIQDLHHLIICTVITNKTF
jgi:hypothetical protein